MSDYSQGKIYIIKSKNTEDVYIGSTKYTLEERFHTHMMNYYKWLRTNKPYVSSYEIIKHGEPYIELLELYPCNTEEELKTKEGEYQLKIECVNIRTEGIGKDGTDKKYRENHRDDINKRQQERRLREEVKEKDNEQSKKWYRENKEYKREYNKKWREENKEKYKEKKLESNKKYYEKNKEIVLQKQSIRTKQKMKCICGATIRCDNKRRHEKSHKHIQYIEEMKEKGDVTNLNEFFDQFKFKLTIN